MTDLPRSITKLWAEITDQTVPQTIHALRKWYSYEKIAHLAGVRGRQTVWRWERGEGEPAISELRPLWVALYDACLSEREPTPESASREPASALPESAPPGTAI